MAMSMAAIIAVTAGLLGDFVKLAWGVICAATGQRDDTWQQLGFNARGARCFARELGTFARTHMLWQGLLLPCATLCQ